MRQTLAITMMFSVIKYQNNELYSYLYVKDLFINLVSLFLQ